MSTAIPHPEAPNTGTPVTPPAEKKKGGCLKWGLIIFGIFILIGALAQACGGSTDSTPAGNMETTSAEPSTPVETTEVQPSSAVVSPAGTPAVAPAPVAQEEVPREHKNALRQAKMYVETMPFSKAKLYDQLTSEYGGQFPADAAQYAIDNVEADWNAEALEAAKNYTEMMGMSDAGLYDQLVSNYGEKFTPEQAQYAIDNL